MNIKANDVKWRGAEFNKLTIVGFVYRNKRWMWECSCACGGSTITYPNQVIRGKTTSCGCERGRTFREMHLKHGGTGTRLYRIWKDMRRRCGRNPKRNRHYGERGIKVCEEWTEFEVFQKWALANGYTDEMSIERIDNDGHYTPNNCKWIPIKEQPFNTRRVILVTIDGVTKPVGQWADQLGISRSTVYGRISKGYSLEDALESM